jgi:hypothetical protein
MSSATSLQISFHPLVCKTAMRLGIESLYLRISKTEYPDSPGYPRLLHVDHNGAMI